MISLNEATKLANQEATTLRVKAILTEETEDYYIFGYTEEVDFPPICINKKTGDVENLTIQELITLFSK